MPEKILMKFNPTRLAFFKWYLVSFILFVVWFLLFFGFIKIGFLEMNKNYLLALPLIGIILIIISEIRVKINRFFISNYRIIEKKGLISLKESSIMFDRISNYRINQNPIDKISNTGTIEIESAGGSEAPEIVMKRVGNIKKIKILLDNCIMEQKRVEGPVV